ncbi:MAG: response regulator transcription factor [Gammaproteobacteria bacterium]|nr:MAG: response regulator transcription factor [Gammaproteobacteria bacterium]TLZ47393.1 MAG: response regulator transcription factor [Gammaproteobacteria bacterium]
MIRVFIADDQMLIRQGIRTLLEMDGNLTVVGEAADGAEAVAALLATAVDVLLLDIRMPGKDGVDVLRDLSARGALPPTLILTTFDDSDVVLDGIRAGARGFLLKDVSYQQLIAAIRAVASGATVFQPAVTERLLRAGRAPRIETDTPRENLTGREAEVVRLMAGGYSNREIAEALGTAEGTVKNHVSSILAKFGVRDRTRAVLKALETGLLRAPDPAPP